MPHHLSITEVQSNNILVCLTIAVNTLEILCDTCNTPFLDAIFRTTQSLLKYVPTVKQNKNDCIQMMEQIHELLYAIIGLHVSSDTGGELSPNMLAHVGKFTETLHKIYTFVEAQQEKSRIRQFFYQGEMSKLLKDCNAGLQQGLNAFKVHRVDLLKDTTKMQTFAERRHREVLELIQSLSDETNSDRSSTISRGFSTRNSSSSLSMLPSEPKIFHGREAELSEIIDAFARETPRIPILGAGGMGKSTLARAVLHHSKITARYGEHRFFVGCDSAPTTAELAALVGSHIGLTRGKVLTRSIIHHFSNGPPSLLILDNLETLWEPMQSRKDVEEMLCLLTDVDDLALIITMRGAERPGKVRWSRPFLLPLRPLSLAAARQTFYDIAEDFHDSRDVDKLLLLTDNMPLAIDLMANLVDYEGCSKILARWEAERTSLMSEGYNRESNLDLSISLSLSSPRITALPQSKDLLSLISMLPDGLSDMELLQSQIPIDSIRVCKAALLRTSLAYLDDNGRLKALVPIREYMQKLHPPTAQLIHPLLKYFRELLEIFSVQLGTQSMPGVVARMQSNFTNIQNILLTGLHPDNPELVNTIYCAIFLSTFSRIINRGTLPVMERIPALLPHLRDHKLETFIVIDTFASWSQQPISNAAALFSKGVEHLSHIDDSDLKCRFYNTVGDYHRVHNGDIPAALTFYGTSLSLSISTGNTIRQSDTLNLLGWIKRSTGDYHAGQSYAFQSQKLAQNSADLYREAKSLHLEAACSYPVGNYRYAINLCTRARQLFSLCGMTNSDADQGAMGSQAEIHKSKSEYREARKIQSHILDMVPIEQDPYRHAFALLNIAEIDVLAGAPEEAVQQKINVSRSILNTVGFARAVIFTNAVHADLKLREGDLLEARKIFKECLASCRGRDIDIITYCLERLGNIQYWGSMQEMPVWTVVFLGHIIKTKQRPKLYDAFQFLGDMFLHSGDEDTGISLLTVALDGFTRMDVHRSRAECIVRLGDISHLRGDPSTAKEHWKAARPLFEQSSQRKEVAGIDTRLAKAKETK